MLTHEMITAYWELQDFLTENDKFILGSARIEEYRRYPMFKHPTIPFMSDRNSIHLMEYHIDLALQVYHAMESDRLLEWYYDKNYPERQKITIETTYVERLIKFPYLVQSYIQMRNQYILCNHPLNLGYSVFIPPTF